MKHNDLLKEAKKTDLERLESKLYTIEQLLLFISGIMFMYWSIIEVTHG